MKDPHEFELDYFGYMILEYKVPLGQGRMALLRVPSNLTSDEAERMAAMIRTLPIGYEEKA